MPVRLSQRAPALAGKVSKTAPRPFAPEVASLRHSKACGCTGCRPVVAQGTLSVNINGTEVKLNNVVEGSTLELDLGDITKGGSSSSPPPQQQSSSTATAPSSVTAPFSSSTLAPGHMLERTTHVRKPFEGSLSMDDFLGRTEVVLCAYGFRGDNSIAVTNLCRDESTGIFKNHIEQIFGSNFNINGLGAVLTCGVTGMGAGLSHAPIDPDTGKERYVFFSFPHVAVDENGKIGSIHRPGREGESAACGALLTALNAFKADGLDKHIKDPGVHDIEEPEFSILKQRIARRIVGEGIDPTTLDLASITKIAARTITSDLEFLISKAVDTKKADYAVVTGIQIHSWPNPDSGAPVLEFIMPTDIYVVTEGERKNIDIGAVPALSPRQAAILSKGGEPADGASAFLANSTVLEVEQDDPAGNPAEKREAQKLLFKSTKVAEGTQSEHQTPGWAKMYTSECC